MAIRLERGKEGRRETEKEGGRDEGLCWEEVFVYNVYFWTHYNGRRVGGVGVGFRIWGYLYTMCTYTTSITSL